ncbi:MAG TPA: DUF1080 domain-containing protein [Thermoanaerobaculia bacterium]|nr:DUF1080 domain-containing protein [Thermoanaerobaculia bacterium]
MASNRASETAVAVVLWAVVLGPALAPDAAAGGRAVNDDGDGAVNRLTAEEQAQGWELLFDGGELGKWRGYKMDRVPDGWSVVGGVVRFARPDAPEAKRSDLITREQYGDFELRLEWKLTPGGNSGVMFRVSEDSERSYHTGPEMQILDNAGHRDGGSPLTSTGANYGLHAPVRDVTRPVGEWNEVRIVAHGPHVEHWLNGVEVVAYELWTEDWRAKVKATKFAQWPRYGLNERGHIALQDHDDEVWFRNLKVRRLDAGAAAQ